MRAWILGIALTVTGVGCAVEEPVDEGAPASCEGGKCDNPTDTQSGHLLAPTIAAGNEHSCAILADGNVRCWGSNVDGESGTRYQPRADGSWGPIKVAKFPGPVRAIAANSSTSCGYVVTSGNLPSKLTEEDDGTIAPLSGATESGVYCWGSPFALPVLDPTAADGVPQLLDIDGMHYGAGLNSPIAGPALTAMTMSLNDICVANGSGVSCYGAWDGMIQSKTYAALSKLVEHEECSGTTCVSQYEPEIKIAELVSGTLHHCARADDGRVWCWGDNSEGAFGNGTKTSSAEPVAIAIPGGAPATHIAALDRETCVSTATDVFCAGHNGFGALGNGTQVWSEPTFQRVALPGKVSQLAGFFDKVCAIVEGDVYCWGYDPRTGISHTTPFRIEGLAGAARTITVGHAHTCVTTDQGVQCWGDNDFGQLGSHDASITDPSFVRAVAGYEG